MDHWCNGGVLGMCDGVPGLFWWMPHDGPLWVELHDRYVGESVVVEFVFYPWGGVLFALLGEERLEVGLSWKFEQAVIRLLRRLGRCGQPGPVVARMWVRLMQT
jgi:hypothetical protein